MAFFLSWTGRAFIYGSCGGVTLTCYSDALQNRETSEGSDVAIKLCESPLGEMKVELFVQK